MFRLTAEEWAEFDTQEAQIIEDQPDGNSSQIVMSLGDETEISQMPDNELSEVSSQIVMTSGDEKNSRKNRGKAYLPYAFTEHGVSMLASVLKSEHDVQLSSIYDAIENLLDEKVNQKSWENRERIGFK